MQWHWSLVERLRPNPELVGPRHEEVEAGRRAAQPLLMELRAAGYPAYDLAGFASQKLPSKQAAAILVKWLSRIDALGRLANSSMSGWVATARAFGSVSAVAMELRASGTRARRAASRPP